MGRACVFGRTLFRSRISSLLPSSAPLVPVSGRLSCALRRRRRILMMRLHMLSTGREMVTSHIATRNIATKALVRNLKSVQIGRPSITESSTLESSKFVATGGSQLHPADACGFFDYRFLPFRRSGEPGCAALPTYRTRFPPMRRRRLVEPRLPTGLFPPLHGEVPDTPFVFFRPSHPSRSDSSPTYVCDGAWDFHFAYRNKKYRIRDT